MRDSNMLHFPSSPVQSLNVLVDWPFCTLYSPRASRIQWKSTFSRCVQDSIVVAADFLNRQTLLGM
jgi:hypothetical protein